MCCMHDTERNTNGFNDIKHIPLNNILAVGRNTYFEISKFKYNMKLEMCPQYTDAPAVVPAYKTAEFYVVQMP